jgi:hypothetical protein
MTSIIRGLTIMRCIQCERSLEDVWNLKIEVNLANYNQRATVYACKSCIDLCGGKADAICVAENIVLVEYLKQNNLRSTRGDLH